MTDTDGFVTYFAYGSCMSPQDFQRTVPQFELLGRAVLDGYEVAFTIYSDGRMGGVADIVPAPDSRVEGVLYAFPEALLDGLDAREGVPDGVYKRIQVEVDYRGQPMQAETYTVVNKADKELAPSNMYRDIILDGARLLSDDYRQQLQQHMETLQSDADSSE